MPFERPSLTTLVARIQVDLAARLGTPVSTLSRRPESALANCTAAVADGLHAHLDWLARQLLPDQCDEEYLGRWAALRGVTRRTQESLADYRARVLDSMRIPPLGGGSGDWARWALEVDGVARAWEVPCWLGPGTVGVMISSGAVPYDQAASQALVQACQAHIEEQGPATIVATAMAPRAHFVDMKIRISPNTATVRASVQAALEQMFAACGQPGGTLLLSQLRGAIATAAGVVDHRVDLPWSDVSIGRTQIPVLGTVNFTAL